ncbi:MAG: LicD family protein [Clostridiales bacterium]|nr:LicD family protein [Clostridiales bacterium]MBE5810088.1 LicD family protein [Clostridiales bacterium]
MDMNQIENLRGTLLAIMDEIHRVCVENGISYYIIGGTALGAIRHTGFIPWDTDIDIAMERGEYERFLRIFNEQASAVFHCAHYMNMREWYHPHALVFKNDTMIYWNKEYYRNKTNVPVYVDVFPLDYCPIEDAAKEEQAKRIKKKIYFQSRRECILYQRNNVIQRSLKKALSFVLHLQSNKSFNKSLDDAMKKYSNIRTDKICSMASHYSYKKQCMDIAIYGTPQEYLFEGRTYYGPERMDEYLTRIYGDYMTPPPPEKQVEYLDYIGYIDFGKKINV